MRESRRRRADGDGGRYRRADVCVVDVLPEAGVGDLFVEERGGACRGSGFVEAGQRQFVARVRPGSLGCSRSDNTSVDVVAKAVCWVD